MLDHLVYAVPDLAAGVAEIERLTGVRAVEGGRHVGLGTRNHLLALHGDGLGEAAYLEIIGPDPDQDDPAGPRPFGIDELTAGRLVTWAIRPPDFDDALATAIRHGYDQGEPREMSRATPEGELLTWRLTPGDPAGGGLVPFLIDWGETTHPTARPMPELRLTGFGGVHPDPAAIRRSLAALDVTLDVAEGAAPALTAVVEGPAGSAQL